MSKRLLMLSTATCALLTGAAVADTTIDSSKSEPYTTGALFSSDDEGTANAGSISIKSGGSVTISGKTQAAITINSNSWLLQQGAITSKDNDAAMAIHVDMNAKPDYTGTSITATGETVSTTGIYLDTNSTTVVSGSGKGKVGLYFDTSSCSANCTFTGNVTMASSAVLSVSGDQSKAIQIGTSSTSSYGIIKGNVSIAGTVNAMSETTNNNSSSSLLMYGLVNYGKIDGNFALQYGGTIGAYGQGAIGMMLAGNGITGAVDIDGTLVASVQSDNSNYYNYYSKINTTTNPEASSALIVGADIGKGLSIGSSGSVTVHGVGPAIAIGSYYVTAQTTPVTLGVYQDNSNPGFSFYNRGAVSSSNLNYNKSSVGVRFTGGNGLATILSGGFYNEGTITASTTTSNDATNSASIGITGLWIDSGVRFDPNLTVKTSESNTDVGDQAALVIGKSSSMTGSISASAFGTRGGTATAIYIASGASIPSLINKGTISASVITTTSDLTASTDPVIAFGIQDLSGSLTSIVNSGAIGAQAGYGTSSSATPTALESNAQSAVAIYLTGNSTGSTIKSYSTANSPTGGARIVGDIVFTSGQNQVLDIAGLDGKPSTVTGNVYFGATTSQTSVHRLAIGSNAVLTGKVVNLASNYSGVQVDIASAGKLNLLNTDTALIASSVNVATNGTLNLGVNRSLTNSGMIQAQSIQFASGANLGVTYASYVPSSSHQFVLMKAQNGQLQINQATLDTFNQSTNRPFLLSKATMCVTSMPGCAKPEGVGSTYDALLIDVETKSASALGLHADSVARRAITLSDGGASTLFDQVNLALAADDALGAAFINGIHNSKEASQAYNDMAPSVTGGTRAIAISLTDQATGPVAARQRALRMYGKTSGDFTLWGQEFVQMIKDPGTGATDPNTGFKTNPGFKDHGFGLSLGLDAGSPKYGWYGGALTFYAGDVNELARNSHQNQQWYLLSLYSVWRGKGLFFDTKIDAGYGHIDGKRTISMLLPGATTGTLSAFVRQAENKHAGALISGGFTTGGMFSYGAATFMPQLSVDGMYLREEGYTEANPSGVIACTGGTVTGICDSYQLKVSQSYAKSLRAFVGLDARYDLKVWDIYLQPEARVGYRYDFLNDPAKIKAAFAYADISALTPQAGKTFELTGPDPSRGNFVLGGTLSTTTDTWTIGLNFDLVKGSNGVFQQVATVNLLGRI